MTRERRADPAHSFAGLLAEARNDRNVIGFFLGGSRGKGRATSDSDYDVYVIVRDSVARPYKRRYERRRLPKIEISVMSEGEFQRHADFDGPDAGDRYDFAHVRAQLDKTGRVQRWIDEKGRIPRKNLRPYVSARFDSYINAVFRSTKSWRDGDSFAARLEAAESIPPLLDALFGMEGRVRPYDKHLRWELETFPLTKFPLKPASFTDALLEILTTADLHAQRELFRHAERAARRAGHGRVFDAWSDHRLGSTEPILSH